MSKMPWGMAPECSPSPPGGAGVVENQLPAVPAAAPPQKLPLTAETVQSLWDQVLATAPEPLAKQLRGAARVQLQGPSVIEVIFAEEKGFSYQFCNRPEKVKQLGELLTAAAGKSVSPRLSLERGASPTPRPAPVRQQPAAEEPELLRNSTVEKDPFVRQVLSLFGGEVVEVRPILVSPPAATMDAEEEEEELAQAEPAES